MFLVVVGIAAVALFVVCLVLDKALVKRSVKKRKSRARLKMLEDLDRRRTKPRS